ncbi:glutamate synthase large subunit [Fibrobacterota bacterium]
MKKQGLYDPRYEHDSCGVGFVVDVKGGVSHQIVSDGLTILMNLAHRGAVGGDEKTGDGAGILTQIPDEFFRLECRKLGFELPQQGEYGVASLFLPHRSGSREKAVSLIEEVLSLEQGSVLGWRKVPGNPACLGELSRQTLPEIHQLFVSFPSQSRQSLETKLFLVRKSMERRAAQEGYGLHEFYVCSFSSRTVVYKGMLLAYQLQEFYPDLARREFKSALALVHQRFSTNTFPSWHLAQPFRHVAHNGEINTLRGNINKMKAREQTLTSEVFKDDIRKILPVINETMSDSGTFDNVLELLYRSGRSLEHSVMMMIPEAFGSRYHISQDKRAFYEYHAAVMEPWDGPAALAFTDGVKIGATLDRNGLRPARYTVTRKGRLIMASETGVLDIEPGEVVHKGRLGPGKMILVDTQKGRIIYDNEIKASVSRKKPYRRWLEGNRIELRTLVQAPGRVKRTRKELKTGQNAFGYTLEDLNQIIMPMATNAQEPVGSMGNDAALAVLSDRPLLLYNYFKQQFAQVTNPPIDPYREHLVMSLMSFIGRERNLMEETSLHCRQLRLPHPILSNDDMDKIRGLDDSLLRPAVVPIFFRTEDGPDGMEKGLNSICSETERRVDEGYSLIVLSDRVADEDRVPIPAVLAVSAVHHHLVKAGKRQLSGLIIETGEAREVMHFAMLIGFGASAINPYLAFETIADLLSHGDVSDEFSIETGINNYITAIKKGILKIMSKMGISTIRSYRGAQIFEAVGLDSGLINAYFPGTPSRIEGISLETVAEESLARHRQAFSKIREQRYSLDSGGNIHFRSHSEKHLLNPEAIALIQKATRMNDYSLYREFSAKVNDASGNLCTLRGLFRFKTVRPVPLDEVEGEDVIMKRFVTPAMSLGSISEETHRTMAIAMNRLGLSSNSGEGGEDENRNHPLPDGETAKSMTRQVASARFGVSSNYLVHASELQIKISQGAKPGEGGQLPGYKVDEIIAKVRNATPGVMLISPPPHHDIYSIEDLAQLIFDLRNASPSARISVKLVAETGVGTVAAGVAKARADMVLISGHDGGTGASPVSSIKHAGIPWEIGLAETQQTLILNGLRDRIRIQVDGKLMTGRDVVIGALLGAEEFGFGTISVVTLGCIMMRKCHLNTCPVGVATQDPGLRKKFAGKPEYLINFLKFVARDVREIMAQLGARTLDELTGRTDLLETTHALQHWKSRGLDLSRIVRPPEELTRGPLSCTTSRGFDLSSVLDLDLIEMSGDALKDKKHIHHYLPIHNYDRTVGAMLSAEVSKRYGSRGLPVETIHFSFKGSAGQSFGAFLAPGIMLELEGDANDYVGKGLSGGCLVVYPPRLARFRPQNNIITGNVNLYGAISGEAYINGVAGERFAVRNSGATAVVEGVGDHGCEYMTGGIVAVLGKTGLNFAAGMSGGIAYVLDEDQLFDTKCNLEMVDIEPITEKEDFDTLFSLIHRHVYYTKSEYAGSILRDWTEMSMRFVKVIPVEYRNALERMKQGECKETETLPITEEVFR